MNANSDSLWRFALQFYQREGAKACLLDLQDQAGADVCVLLGLLWLGARGWRPADDQLAALVAPTVGWQRRVTERLRAKRRSCQRGSYSYRCWLALELRAERHALRLFARYARALYPAIALPGTAVGPDDHAAQRHNAERYLSEFAAVSATHRQQLWALLAGPDALD